jgi:hypothetical protein
MLISKDRASIGQFKAICHSRRLINRKYIKMLSNSKLISSTGKLMWKISRPKLLLRSVDMLTSIMTSNHLWVSQGKNQLKFRLHSKSNHYLSMEKQSIDRFLRISVLRGTTSIHSHHFSVVLIELSYSTRIITSSLIKEFLTRKE